MRVRVSLSWWGCAGAQGGDRCRARGIRIRRLVLALAFGGNSGLTGFGFVLVVVVWRFRIGCALVAAVG